MSQNIQINNMKEKLKINPCVNYTCKLLAQIHTTSPPLTFGVCFKNPPPVGVKTNKRTRHYIPWRIETSAFSTPLFAFFHSDAASLSKGGIPQRRLARTRRAAQGPFIEVLIFLSGVGRFLLRVSRTWEFYWSRAKCGAYQRKYGHFLFFCRFLCWRAYALLAGIFSDKNLRFVPEIRLVCFYLFAPFSLVSCAVYCYCLNITIFNYVFLKGGQTKRCPSSCIGILNLQELIT